MFSDGAANPLKWANDHKMRRKEAAALAAALGYPVAPATLAKLAVQGGGPEITYFGTLPLYEVGAFKRWLNGRTHRAHSVNELRSILADAAA